MITLLKRHEIQVLLNASHTQGEVASLAKVSERSVRRIAAEAAVEHVDDPQERAERRIGRPRKVDRFRPLVEQLLQETDEDRSPLKSVEILRRVRLDGYDGGKTALYELVAELRPRHTRVMMRFEGLPGEFSQHDFGQVRLRYLDGTHSVVRFFGSRLKWSRWAAVDLVDGEDAETLVRTVAEHFVRFGGVPLCAVFGLHGAWPQRPRPPATGHTIAAAPCSTPSAPRRRPAPRTIRLTHRLCREDRSPPE